MAFRGLLASSVLKRLLASLPEQACAAGSTLCSSSSSSSAAVGLSSLRPVASAAGAALRRGFAAQPALAAEEAEEALPPIPIEQHSEQGQYRDLLLPLYDLNKQQVGTITLVGKVFDVPIRRDILHRVVRWQLAKQQQGMHKTKTRSEVRGGGRKPRPQKGSGASRQGTIRAPQWKGGGVAHGPVLRSHEHSLQKRVRRLGLQCALSAKAWERRLLVVDTMQPAEARTKVMDAHLDLLLAGAPRRSVMLVDGPEVEGMRALPPQEDKLRLATSNLPWVNVCPWTHINVYAILQRDYLVVSKNAVERIVERMRRPIKPASKTP